MKNRIRKKLALIGAVSLLLGASSAFGNTNTYNFDTDPTTLGTNSLEIISGYLDSLGNPVFWKPTGGNPESGGFLALTWPIGGSSDIILFPDIDGGQIVTAFTFETDLRIGNPQQNERAADGFSINFARANDPVFANKTPNDFAVAGAVETGTTTGLAISFDTWSGNALPDGADIEGIIVRVDNVTVLRQGMPTRNGACADITSLQTGPRDTAYWDTAHTDGTLPDAAFLPQTWTNLCWAHLKVELDLESKLTVTFKGSVILDHYQTSFFPSAGGLVLAGRTGGSDEQTHFDNLVLSTVPSGFDTTAPTVPANFRVTQAGARRVALAWDPSFDASGRIAYTVSRDGVAMTNIVITTTNFTDLDVKPGTAYAYKVRAVDVSLNTSADASVAATTAAEAPGSGFLVAQIYDNIAGGLVDDLLAAATFPASPDRTRYINGLSFGDPAFGNTYGENLGVRITTVLTAPETGSFRFFVRSDDGSAIYVNKTGPGIPDPATAIADAIETDCCGAFMEPGVANTDTTTFSTSEPIALTAGQQYGILFIVKEGGGGDWGQVAMRKEGDTTPAASLQPIRGPMLSGFGDSVGAAAAVTQDPQSATVFANESVTFTFAGTASTPYVPTPGISVPSWTQWYKDNVLIPGANGNSYTIPVVPASYNGAKFKAVIGTIGATATSAEATLTVNTDNKAPTLAGVDGSDTFTTITVAFSEPVTAPTATTAGNYTLTGGLVVSAPVLVDPFHVKLTTTAQAVSTAYTLTVNNVQDNAGNPVAANSQVTFKTWGLVAGRVKIETYGLTGDSIGGTDVASLVADARYPNSPDSTRYLNNGITYGEPAFGNTLGENYGARLTGILVPKVSGNYNFFVRSDDASALFINKTGPTFPDAATATPDAQENGCCNPFQEPGAPSANTDGTTFRTSGSIALTAGQQYGIMFLVKEGGGGDWGQVAMRPVGVTTPAASALRQISDQVYSYGPPTPAETISVNFQGRTSTDPSPATTPLAPAEVAGVVAVPNWNNVDNAYGAGLATFTSANKGTTGSLTNSAGAATPVTLTFNANDSWNNDVDPTTITTANAKMMNGVIKQQGAGTSATFTFNGVPDGQYDVYVYTDSNNDGVALDITDINSGATTYTINTHQFTNTSTFVQATNTNPAGPRDTGSYIKLGNVSTTGGQILLSAKYVSGGDGLGIAGIQIVSPPGAAVTQPQFITSKLAVSNGNLHMEWTGTGTLVGSATAHGTYGPVAGVTGNSADVPVTGTAQFFQIQQ